MLSSQQCWLKNIEHFSQCHYKESDLLDSCTQRNGIAEEIGDEEEGKKLNEKKIKTRKIVILETTEAEKKKKSYSKL